MATRSSRQTADVVFCIDASASMQPCFDAVKTHIGEFLKGLQSGGQGQWDVKFGYLAYRAGKTNLDQHWFDFESLRSRGMKLLESLYANVPAQSEFFTDDVSQFGATLTKVKAQGDEASLVGLDTALDYPWRDAAACHRVIVQLTDEALETGVFKKEQVELIPDLIEKIHQLRVMLFLVAPPSKAFEDVSAAEKSEYHVVADTHKGLVSVDFQQVLREIGKSVSVSVQHNPAATKAVRRGLFGQSLWRGTDVKVEGA